MPPITAWRPMSTAPRTIDRLWLRHPTLGTILAEGRTGRWYSPNASRQIWRWHRPDAEGALETFTGWRPFDAHADSEPGHAAR